MKDVVIVRDRGQITIPDAIRKTVSWVTPLSAVSISVMKPDEIIIRPHQTNVRTSELWDKIKNSRSIRGKGTVKAAEFLAKDRQR